MNDYGQSVYNQGKSTGENALNAYDPSATASGYLNKNNAMFGSQVGGGPSNATDYMTAYKNSISANPAVQQLYQQGNQMFNVQPLAQNANQLQNAILQAPQQTLDTARGFNYDANQIANQVNLTLGRLSPLAAAATNQAQTAQQLANQYVQAGITQNQMNLLPIQQYGSMLADAMARQSTGFTTAMQAEFQGLQAKMQAGVQLSQAEIQRANQLASSQYAYEQAIKTAQLNNQFQTVPQGSNLVNTFLGTAVNPSMLTSRTGTAKFR